MKSLLIYNDNIASNLVIDFQNKLGLTYKFQIGKQELLRSNFTIDEKIDRALKDEIENIRYDCVFIPFSLSDENYLEFLGLRFACHIRLTQEFNNIQTPIIFFGYETESDVNKLSELGSFLFSKGVYTTKKVSIKNFKEQIEFVSETHNKIDNNIFLKDFTKRVSISTSGNYSTHHSITNEWSIYRWASSLKIENANIKNIEKKIGYNLYLKYLKAQFPIKKPDDLENKIISEKGKLLYIDDEVEKGWGTIFQEICKKPKFKYIGANFKNLSSNQIINIAINEVLEFEPDVVILDFRLHDDDFETIATDEITGFKILEKIKEINLGIQVIVLSATNKIRNLLQLQDTGADNFILKESPELSVDENYSRKTLSDIFTVIENGLKKKYLKRIFFKLTPLIKDFESFSKLSPKTYFKRNYILPQSKVYEIEPLLKSSSALLKLNNPELKFAFLQLILIIEDLVKTFYLENNQGNHYVEKSIVEKIFVLNKENSNLYLRLEPKQRWNKFMDRKDMVYEISSDDKDFKYLNNKSDRILFNYRLHCVLFFKYEVSLNEIVKFSQLYRKRSKLSHPNNIVQVKPEDLILAIELISIFSDNSIFKKKNI